MNTTEKYILQTVLVVGLLMIGAFFLPHGEKAPLSGAYSIQTSGGGAQPRQALVAATTTPCAIAAPTSATTSIQHFAFTVTNATSSAGTLTISTSTTAYATSTTPIATFTVGANAQYTYTWNGGVNNDVVYPGTFIVVGMTNGSAVNYGYTYGGTCSIVLVTD